MQISKNLKQIISATLPLIGLLFSFSLSACQSPPTFEFPKKVGADKDAHACIASAGYSWCAKEGACVRPWKLAIAKSISNDKASFDEYCQNSN